MEEQQHPSEKKTPRDAANWAGRVDKLHVSGVSPEALNLNVEGRRVLSPLQGFGQMWQKTYRMRLPRSVATPETVISTWKERYAEFWPKGNRFYAPLTGIRPGEVGVINATQGPMRLSTGVLVLYSDDTSFTFMTPEGHPFAGWITFSAHEEGEDVTVAQAQLLLRPGDPIYELGFKMFGSRTEDKMWQHTVASLGAALGSPGDVETEIVCVDRRRQWSQFGAVKHNAIFRTTLGAPMRGIRRLAGPRR
ncbi:MAG: hypothetical protein H0V96_06305 [Acidimicrobiia bacterium]|nr:hypothetical protein [Acidimicrobiia bacterium]